MGSLDTLLGTNYRLDGTSGYAINTDHERVAAVIHDVYPDISLAWIPPDKRQPGDMPFALIHTPLGKPEYVIRTLEEKDVNETLLAWIIKNDTSKTNPLAAVEADDLARELIKARAWEDIKEERGDIAAHILRSGRARYRHNGVVYE